MVLFKEIKPFKEASPQRVGWPEVPEPCSTARRRPAGRIALPDASSRLCGVLPSSQKRPRRTRRCFLVRSFFSAPNTSPSAVNPTTAMFLFLRHLKLNILLVSLSFLLPCSVQMHHPFLWSRDADSKDKERSGWLLSEPEKMEWKPSPLSGDSVSRHRGVPRDVLESFPSLLHSTSPILHSWTLFVCQQGMKPEHSISENSPETTQIQTQTTHLWSLLWETGSLPLRGVSKRISKHLVHPLLLLLFPGESLQLSLLKKRNLLQNTALQ